MRDALFVEGGGDLARAHAVGIEAVDAAHGLGLVGVDLAQAAQRLAVLVDPVGVSVAVAKPARYALGVDRADLAAPGLEGEVFDKGLVHQPADADMDRSDLALVERDQADVPESQPLVDSGEVFLVAADAVEGLGADQVDEAVLGVLEETCQAGRDWVMVPVTWASAWTRTDSTPIWASFSRQRRTWSSMDRGSWRWLENRA